MFEWWQEHIHITWRSRTVVICTSSYKGRWQYLSESSWNLPAWEFYDSRHRSITPDFGWCRSAVLYFSCCFYLIAPPPQKKDRTLFPGCYFDDIYNASFHHISHFSALFFWAAGGFKQRTKRLKTLVKSSLTNGLHMLDMIDMCMEEFSIVDHILPKKYVDCPYQITRVRWRISYPQTHRELPKAQRAQRVPQQRHAGQVLRQAFFGGPLKGRNGEFWSWKFGEMVNFEV